MNTELSKMRRAHHDPVAHILSGKDATRWRTVHLVNANPKTTKFSSFEKHPEILMQIADHMNNRGIAKPTKDGMVLIGFKASGWKRPFIIKTPAGRLLAGDLHAVKKLWKNQK